MSSLLMIVIRRATPARITLGVTTVLTITTLKANADSNLPHTSYPKVNIILLSIKLIFLYLGHRALSLGVFCLHLRCIDRVLCRRLSGEEEDHSAGQQQEPHSQGSLRY